MPPKCKDKFISKKPGRAPRNAALETHHEYMNRRTRPCKDPSGGRDKKKKAKKVEVDHDNRGWGRRCDI
jgi:hypothetical protein